MGKDLSIVDAPAPRQQVSAVSTVAEIEAALPQLSTEELLRVEQALHQQYRRRGGGIIYHDSYGVVTEADLIASAEETFLACDREEAEHAQHRAG